MKFRRKDPRAWIYFLVTAVNIVVGMVLARLRLTKRASASTRVALFGHSFNGNLRAFYERAGAEASDMDCRFIYIDRRRYRSHDGESGAILCATRPTHVAWVASADVFITDRRSGVFELLRWLRPSLPVVGVWHGVGYKGVDPQRIGHFRDFAALFTSSEWKREAWHAKGAGPPLERIKVTGYARTDQLVLADQDPQEAVERFRLNNDASARVLIAPTWNQSGGKSSVFPFGMNAEAFLNGLEAWAQACDVEVVFRSHTNTQLASIDDGRNVIVRPSSRYPTIEGLLLVSDVLVTDWSSIATDFLILNRPIVFLDVPATFTRGFGSLDPSDRAGQLVQSFSELLKSLDSAVQVPEEFRHRFGTERDRVLRKAFGETLDGKCSDRYLNELRALSNGMR